MFSTTMYKERSTVVTLYMNAIVIARTLGTLFSFTLVVPHLKLGFS